MININATLVVQLINFLILVWILNRILFKPIFRIIEEREQTLEDSKAEMKRLQVEAEHKSRTLETHLLEARQSASKSKDKISSQAAAQAEEIISQAQAKAEEHISSVKAQAVGQAEQVRQSLGDYKEAIVEMVLLKVMGRKV